MFGPNNSSEKDDLIKNLQELVATKESELKTLYENFFECKIKNKDMEDDEKFRIFEKMLEDKEKEIIHKNTEINRLRKEINDVLDEISNSNKPSVKNEHIDELQKEIITLKEKNLELEKSKQELSNMSNGLKMNYNRLNDTIKDLEQQSALKDTFNNNIKNQLESINKNQIEKDVIIRNQENIINELEAKYKELKANHQQKIDQTKLELSKQINELKTQIKKKGEEYDILLKEKKKLNIECEFDILNDQMKINKIDQVDEYEILTQNDQL